MSLKEVVDRDCGGSNALMKLTTHFTEDKALQQRGFGQQPVIRSDVVPFDESSEHELVQEFLAQNPRFRDFCVVRNCVFPLFCRYVIGYI